MKKALFFSAVAFCLLCLVYYCQTEKRVKPPNYPDLTPTMLKVYDAYKKDPYYVIPDSVLAHVKQELDVLDSLDVQDKQGMEMRLFAKFLWTNYLIGMGEFRPAFPHLDFIERVIPNRKDLFPDSARIYLAHTFNMHGIGLQRVFEPEQAQLYFEKAKAIYQEQASERNVYYSWLNLVDVKVEMGQYSESLKILSEQEKTDHFQKMTWQTFDKWTLFQKYGKAVLGLSDSLRQAGHLKLADEKCREAIAHFSTLLAGVARLDSSLASPQYNFSRAYLAKAYLELGTPIAADSALILLKMKNPTPDVVRQSYLISARAWGLKSNLGKALEAVQIALDSFGYPTLSLTDYPPLTMRTVPDKKLLLEAFALKGKLLREQGLNTRNAEQLDLSLKSYEMALAVLDTIRLRIATASIQGEIGNRFGRLFHDAARTAFERAKMSGKGGALDSVFLEKALQFAERGKDFQLRQALHFQSEKSEDGRFRNYFEREDQFRRLIATEDFQWKGGNKAALAKYDSLVRAFDLFLDSIRQTPYDTERRAPVAVSFRNLRSTLLDSDTTAFIEFSISSEQTLVFCITRNSSDAQLIPHSEKELALLESYGQGLASDATTAFEETAHPVFKHFLASTLGKLPKKIRRLVFVPDGRLREVAFEAMLTQEPPASPKAGYSEFPYLLKSYHVSYLHSFSTYFLHKRQGAADRSFGGFIAKYDDVAATAGKHISAGDRLSPLPKLAEACRKSAKLFKEKPFEPATRQDFLDQAKNFDILFFAMHGFAGKTAQADGSYLQFSAAKGQEAANRLTMGTVYFSRLNARLAIFGACQTGRGANRRGEGIAGMARSFDTAGVPSLVATLSNIPDREATAALLVSFLENVKAGMPLDAALRKAKLDYLRQPGLEAQAQHPFFWSNFVLIGRADAIF